MGIYIENYQDEAYVNKVIKNLKLALGARSFHREFYKEYNSFTQRGSKTPSNEALEVLQVKYLNNNQNQRTALGGWEE